jgi:hypothetical protein
VVAAVFESLDGAENATESEAFPAVIELRVGAAGAVGMT